MPRLVDPRQRGPLLWPLVFRMAAEGGCEALTVRAIATEFGISPGALRHNFPRQGDLIELAMKKLARERLWRLERIHLPMNGQGRLRLLSEGSLPLDEERRTEATAWLAFEERARHHQGMARIAAHVRAETRKRRRVWMHWAGVVEDAVALEAERLDVVLAGLTSRLCDLEEPLPPAEAAALLRAHLHQYDDLPDTLAGRPPEPPRMTVIVSPPRRDDGPGSVGDVDQRGGDGGDALASSGQAQPVGGGGAETDRGADGG